MWLAKRRRNLGRGLKKGVYKGNANRPALWGGSLAERKVYIAANPYSIMPKNMCGKTRKIDEPYETWRGPSGFEWRVLKKYQTEKNESENPYARWFCAVSSPLNWGSFDHGDVYVKEIQSSAVRVWSYLD